MPRLFCLAFVLCIALPLRAQVSGSVTDPAGAPLNGARVIITNVERNQTQHTVTDARGRFRFATLAVGDYAMTIDAVGFAPVRRSVRLTIGAALDVPVRLQIAEAEGVGRNTGQGFDFASLDVRLSRTFAIGRGLSLETMIEAFNVLNRTNLQVPNNIITSPTFGQATAANDPRQIQFGMRVLFGS